MEDIKVGEYVRTKKGYIAQITEIDKYIWFNNKINKESGIPVYELSKVEFENLVTKHSPNIIDLIEEGDIIEYKSDSFDDIFKEEVWKTKGNDIVYIIDGAEININSIKSIVTKEMFSSVEYRVENN